VGAPARKNNSVDDEIGLTPGSRRKAASGTNRNSLLCNLCAAIAAEPWRVDDRPTAAARPYNMYDYCGQFGFQARTPKRCISLALDVIIHKSIYVELFREVIHPLNDTP